MVPNLSMRIEMLFDFLDDKGVGFHTGMFMVISKTQAGYQPMMSTLDLQGSGRAKWLAIERGLQLYSVEEI